MASIALIPVFPPPIPPAKFLFDARTQTSAAGNFRGETLLPKVKNFPGEKKDSMPPFPQNWRRNDAALLAKNFRSSWDPSLVIFMLSQRAAQTGLLVGLGWRALVGRGGEKHILHNENL
jgi:hypothetical protein